MSIYNPPEFANTTAEPSSFTVLNRRKLFDKKIPAHCNIPKGRPLWQIELSKKNPPPTTYDPESSFGSKATHIKTTATSFKNSYNSYRRTCDIQTGIKVYHNDNDTDTKGLDYDVNLTQTKRRFPAFSQSKAK